MTAAALDIRDATSEDAERCAEIYAPYVADTAISFEAEPPTTPEMAQRIATAQQAHAWLVASQAGRVVGYAYGGELMSRAAYAWSCTVSVYLETGRRRTGAGRALYRALFERLADRGYRQAFAGITLPNAPSEGLHAAMGFEPVGVQRSVGWKAGEWRDVGWLQRDLGAGATSPPAPLR